jgi:hypothetical protein
MLNFIGGVVSFVSATLALFPDPAAGLTIEKSQRAMLGRTTLSRVESKLGCPPGDYRTGLTERKEGMVDAGPGWFVAKWYGDSFVISLHIDDAGRSHGFSWTRTGVPAEWPDRLLWRIKWHWHKSFP